jgi:mono/diheme cytochrome c family protein
LFVKNCSGCHGLKGQGKLGPSLNSPVFQANADDDYLYITISAGRPNTAMPAFAQEA